ncbi:MAG: ShlB/FhaC/HecB family hemolysin secretion/activation protein [Janthinobacterium lividum]
MLLGGASPAMAQAYDRVAPKLPVPDEVPTLVPPPLPMVSNSSAAPVVPSLNGVVFVGGMDAVATVGAALPSGGIDVTAVAELDDARFKAQIAPFFGKPLSLADLDRIRAFALSWLRAHGRPFADVTAPPQNVAGGVVRIVVTQYRLGRITVEGARHFSPALIKRRSGLEPGQTLALASLQRDLARLNQNPFLTVDAIFKPGVNPGETEITLGARDRLPLRVYAGYDNLGVRSLGVGEYNLGINWGNVFGTGGILSYQFTRTISGRYTSHSLSDVVPLASGDQLLIFGSYASSRPRLPEIFNDVGHSGQASIRYVHRFDGGGRLTQDVQVGYDFKTTDNNLEFAGFQVFGTRAEVNQFPIVYDGTLTDRLGQTAVQNILVLSPGGLTGDNTTTALAALVPGARARYAYDRLLVTRTTRLPAGLASITRATGQIATHNLPNSEQLGGGGVGSVRGYFADTALGSTGVLASQEVRLPAFGLTRLLRPGSRLDDQMQFGVFVDYARLTQVTPIPDVLSRVTLLSVGGNVHYSLRRFLDVQADLGWRLKRTVTAPTQGAYAQVSVTIGF